MKAKLLALLTLVFATELTWAFPEMVRHGYTQCTACHISPAGGGILNKYGRELSSELLSTWSYYTDESQFLHSKVGKDLAEKGIFVGGDVRGAQVYAKSPGQETAKLFLMMADLQGAYQTGKFTGVVSVGQIKDPTDRGGLNGNFNATEYYGMVNFTDEISVRAGRFVPTFGLNMPDHTLVTKRMLGFMPTFEFDTVELGYLSEHWTILASAARSTPSFRIARQQAARTLNVDYALLERMRIGVNYWSGQGPKTDQHIGGVHGILGFTKHFYNMTEVDVKYESAQNGLFSLTQFAYEVFQGCTPYFQYQQDQSNMANYTTLNRTYGVGFHFYPRPHFELSAEWDQVKSEKSGWSDAANVLGHYYF